MPEQIRPAADKLTDAEQKQPAPGRTSLLNKLAILIFLAGVVTTECVVVYFFLPSRAETAVLTGVPLDGPSPNKRTEADPLHNVDQSPSQVEVDLGEFSVTAYQPISNTTLRIDFHLYGTVAAEEEKEFLARLEGNAHRFRDQVIVTLRSSDITDLTDAGLGLIKRKILEKSNAMLGKRFLRAVIFSDFSFVEQ